MPTFILTPNQRILSRYLTSATDAEFDAEYPNYIPVTIENTVEWYPFEDEATFEKNFKELLTKHNLIEHYDNLLFLTLYICDIVWQEMRLAHKQYDSKKRAKEIAQLLLMLQGTAKGKLSNVGFKSFNDSVKLTDTILNDWISKTLIDSLQKKDFLVSQFGAVVLEMLTGNATNPFDNTPANPDTLNRYANMRLTHPKNRIKKGNVTICLVILSYLNGETILNTSEEITFSDAQLNFLFDLLETLKAVDRLKIDSEPKDYMRTLIVNYLKP